MWCGISGETGNQENPGEARFVGHGGITVSAGQPTFLRWALTCDAQGSIKQWDIDTLYSAEEAGRQTVTYRKIR